MATGLSEPGLLVVATEASEVPWSTVSWTPCVVVTRLAVPATSDVDVSSVPVGMGSFNSVVSGADDVGLVSA
jgi:hypothetical protein